MHNSTDSPFNWEEIFCASLEDVLNAIPLDVPLPLKKDGKYYRFSTKENGTGQAGFYSFNGRVLRVGDWRTNQAWVWRNGAVTDTEEADQEQREEFEHKAKEYQEEQQGALLYLWEAAEECQSHPYLDAKNLTPVGLRTYQTLLLVPGFDRHRALKALQKITASGHKSYIVGSQPKRAYFSLHQSNSRILYITESVSNALAIFHSVDHADIWSTFGTGNMAAVARVAKNARLPVVIVADKDPEEQGEKAGKEAAALCLGKLYVPEFGDTTLSNGSCPTDICDMWELFGADEVRAVLGTAEYPPQVIIRRLFHLAKQDPYKAQEELKKLIEDKKLGWSKRFIEQQMKKEAEAMDAEAKEERWGERESATKEKGEGAEIEIREIIPWKDPVKGEELLDDLTSYYSRVLSLPKYGAEVLGLWTVHTYLMDAIDTTPYLGFTSPGPRCGKSKGLIAVSYVCHRPLTSTSISPAALFRVIEAQAPTLLVDEFDMFMKNEELRGILNAGYTRDTANVIRCVGDENEPRSFSVWAAKAFTLIGRLPDTLADRTISIRMKRKKPSEKVERLRSKDKKKYLHLCAKAQRFAQDIAIAIQDAEPVLPEALNDRQQDIWEPLFAIAGVAGGKWPEKVKSAALGLTGEELQDVESQGIMLLADMEQYFREKKVKKVFSDDLATYLATLEERPWAEYRYDKPITQTQIAKLLRPFEIRPKSVEIGDKNLKGYALDQCAESFERYLGVFYPSVRQDPSGERSSEDFSAVSEKSPDGSKTPPETASHKDPDGLTGKKGVPGQKNIFRSDIPIEELDNDACAPDPDGDTHTSSNEGSEAPTEDGSEDLIHFDLATEEEDLKDKLTQILTSEIIAVDLETTGLDPLVDRIRIISLAIPGKVLVVDMNAIPVSALGAVFAGEHTLILHNAKFDLKFLGHAGIWLQNGKRLFDTYVASYLLSAGIAEPLLCPWDKKDPKNKGKRRPGPHALVEVAKRCLGVDLDKSLQTSDWSAPELSKEQLTYAGMDAYILLALRECLADKLKEAGLNLVAQIEFRAIPAFAWLELAGMPIDREGWEALARSKEAAAEAAKAELDALAPGVNWRSAPQVKALFNSRGHEIEATGIEVLQDLVDKDPIVAALVKYREVATLASTYGMQWANKHIHPKTGRVHAEFVQLGSVAGRTSCRKPNLQNIPRDQRFRGLFKAPEGMSIIKLDYSQIELRIMAALSGDEAMLEAYRNGQDVHRKTAAVMSGVAEGDVTKEQRQKAKAVNFGLIYGMGATTLMSKAKEDYGVILSEEEARQYRDKFFETYPGIRRWHLGRPKGPIETRTMVGRRRLEVAKFTEKCNTPDQGTGADGLKIALGRIYEQRDRLHGAAIIDVVHDEVLLECPAEHADEVTKTVQGIMVEAMEYVVSKQVPIVVDITVSEGW